MFWRQPKKNGQIHFSIPFLRQMQNDKTGRGIAINDMVFNVQSEVIRQLAEKNPASSLAAALTMCAGAVRGDLCIHLRGHE